MDHPFKISAFANGEVGLRSRVTLACPIIPRIDQWLDEIVRPAAMMYFGTRLVDLKAGSYSCRPRNGQRGAKLSEHSFGNALDVMGFALADGREVSVVKGWRGSPAEQEFLREVFVGACRYFTTVLGPGSDSFHYDHLHIDLARHDPRGYRRVCKPYIRFTPRIDPEKSQEIMQNLAASADLPSTEMEQDMPEEETASPGRAPPMGSPMGAPVVAAPRYPAPSAYPAHPPPPNAAYSRAPPAYGRPPAQTYAPPRPSAGEPMMLNRHGIY
jgi:hypothetical protein